MTDIETNESQEYEYAELLSAVKLVLRRPAEEDDFDDEIKDLIEACLIDLGIAGVDGPSAVSSNPAIVQAVKTYCKAHFGFVERDLYERLKMAYDEQKAQLSMSDGFTRWIRA